MTRKRIIIAGTGTRALNFAEGIINRCSGHSELVGLYDRNPERMAGFCQLTGKDLPMFTDFKTMVEAVRPDTAVICVTDCAHPDLIELAFSHGLDAVVEKPLAMDREGIERIRRAEQHYGRKVTVTFNMRFAPYSAAIKEVMMEQPVGKIHTVSAEWFIDRTHGIEYFHRWHSRLSNGGGLLVHKATHNFDLLNWFLDATPAEVFAWGSLQQFGAAGPYRGSRCRDCTHAKECPAALNTCLEDADLNPKSDGNIFKKLYFEAEKSDGYLRDQCCFDPNIDIYDTMNALIRYRNGIQVSYALNAYSAWQGYRIVFTGDHGLIEVGTVNHATRPADYVVPDTIRIVTGTTRRNVVMREISMEENTTPHGGGDWAMFDHLFGGIEADPFGQTAGFDAGAASAMIGICANESIRSNLPVKLPDWL